MTRVENFIAIHTQEWNLGTKSMYILSFASRVPGCTSDWPHLCKGSCNPAVANVLGNTWH